LNSSTIKVREGWGRILLGANDRDAERVESTKREAEQNWDAHMKEPEHNTDSTIDLGKTRKKTKRRIEFQQFKTEEMERIEEEGGIVHRGKRHPLDVQSTGGESKKRSSK
jgi:hypothetical protein